MMALPINIEDLLNADSRDYSTCKGYKFRYDTLDRLTSAQYAEGFNLSSTPQYDYSDSVVYNPNSAITHLRRMGKSLQGGACIDNVSFTYSGNQLSAAQDTGIPASLMGDAFHFVDGDDYYSEYSYDGCGALTSDSNKGVYKILYDFNGMPTCVWFDNGSITDYVYTADGVKLKTVHRTAVPGTVPSGSTPSLSEQNTLSKDSTLYVGALEVESSIREKYYYANGYLDIVYGNLDSYNYYATDHLGNVRHVARATPSGVGSIIQTNNYYPFGGLLNEGDNQLYVQKKLYNGKEYDRMQGLNLYDYGARQYDPAICRFTSMDPLCEKYYNISPYAYCGGNPVNRIDPDGRDWYSYDGCYQWVSSTNETYKDKSGNKWKNVGHTYTDYATGMYYSLFGQKYNKGHKDLKAVKSIDNAMIGILQSCLIWVDIHPHTTIGF